MALCAVTACAQDPATAFPQNYRVLIDNPDVLVLHAHYGPHESLGVHDHSGRPTVYVYLNDSGPVRFVHQPEGLMLDRPPTHTGGFRVSPGQPERHTLTNLSDRPSDYLRVELKQVPLGTIKQEFRKIAPQSPLVPGTTVEFTNAQLTIERIVCEAPAPCALPASRTPSVVVAFSPVRVSFHAKWQILSAASPVVWLRPGEAASARSADSTPAHLLRIYPLAHVQP